jgi:hypothetical protein
MGDATGKLESVTGAETTGLPASTAATTIPVPVSFVGMPNTRWWAFEDAKTNCGEIDADTTDLATLLFLEFALVYANDWFVIPYTLPAGTIATVRGLEVTNTFGERFWIEGADVGGRRGLAAMEHVHIRNRTPGRRERRYERCCCCRPSPR